MVHHLFIRAWKNDERKKFHARFRRRRVSTDIVAEEEVAIIIRDYRTLYADVFRLIDSKPGQKVPAILPWSPYAKTGGGVQHYDNIAPFRVGLRLDHTSGYEKFERLHSADWVPRSDAIVNIDVRGAGRSEGDMVFWGQQEAEDVYGTIYWISKKP